jgi:hypothetical protein
VNPYVQYEILVVVKMWISVFCLGALMMEVICSSETLVTIYKTIHCHIPEDHQGALMVEAVHTFETSVNVNVTTWCYIPENSKRHTCCHENFKSHAEDHDPFFLWLCNIIMCCVDTKQFAVQICSIIEISMIVLLFLHYVICQQTQVP